MRRHHSVWLGGSALIGLISTLYALFQKSLPVGLLAALAGTMFVIACFRAWREEYFRSLDVSDEMSRLEEETAGALIRIQRDSALSIAQFESDKAHACAQVEARLNRLVIKIEADRNLAVSEQSSANDLLNKHIHVLMARIHELENPPIQAKIIAVLASAQTRHAWIEEGEWLWSIRLLMQVIPPPGRQLTLFDECKVELNPNQAGLNTTVSAQVLEFALDGEKVNHAPIHISQAANIRGNAYIAAVAWQDPLPQSIEAVIRLADANSEWKYEARVQLNFNPEGHHKEWRGSPEPAPN
jgi:hypothetical protein